MNTRVSQKSYPSHVPHEEIKLNNNWALGHVNMTEVGDFWYIRQCPTFPENWGLD